MDTVDLENAEEEVRSIMSIYVAPEGGAKQAAEYLHRLLAERYTAGWDDAMDTVGNRLSVPAPAPTRFREGRAR